MKRREFITLVSGAVAAWPTRAWTQPATMLRVGTANVQPRSAPHWVAFTQRMAALGYIEGKNFTYDHVQVANPQAWEATYREVVTRRPDIIIAAGPEQSLKSALATSGSLPVVMIAVDYDPIASGYVKSLGRPADNITGVYFQSTELAGKQLQLLKEMSPDLKTATVFWDKTSADYWAALQAAAVSMGVRLVGIELREPPYDYERAIAGLAPEDRKFLVAVGSPFFFLDRGRLAEAALRHRMVSLVQAHAVVSAGALMSYGPDLNVMFALAANYIERIAKGAKPIDLPVEQPTKFDLVLNLQTAKAIGIEIPNTLVLRADALIE